MTSPPAKPIEPRIEIARLTQLAGTDLEDLCEATERAIDAGGGFGWIKPPRRHVLESYWKGVLLIPDRHVLAARLDGAIAGSVQLIRAPRNNEAQAHQAQLTTLFVVPWARGRGLGKRLSLAAEQAAREQGLALVNLDLRETQAAAIGLFEKLGYRRWGEHPGYASVDGAIVRGFYYWKPLAATAGRTARRNSGPGDMEKKPVERK